MVVHGLHFKTKTERNPSHTLSPATASDARQWGVSYDLSVPQILQGVCDKNTWKSSVAINFTLPEGHAHAGRSVRCPSFKLRTFCHVSVYVCFPNRVFCLTHVLFLVHNAGDCEGDTKIGFDIDMMQAASPVWIRQLLVKVISKHITLDANPGSKNRVVAVSAT